MGGWVNAWVYMNEWVGWVGRWVGTNAPHVQDELRAHHIKGFSVLLMPADLAPAGFSSSSSSSSSSSVASRVGPIPKAAGFGPGGEVGVVDCFRDDHFPCLFLFWGVCVELQPFARGHHGEPVLLARGVGVRALFGGGWVGGWMNE